MQSRQIAIRGVLVATALVLSWIEFQFTAWIPFPGMKLGLTNLVVLVALYRLGNRDAMMLNLLRIFLVALSFGNGYALMYSLAGGMLSTTLMMLLKKTSLFGVSGISIIGGVSHNTGQILVAALVLQTSQISYYLPILWIGGVASGLAIGWIGSEIIKRMPKLNIHREEKTQ